MTAILNQHDNYHQAEQAYNFPLLIKNLLTRSRVVSGQQTLHFADRDACTYHDFFKKINRLANT